MSKRTGKVKWFNETKGFGFIVPDDGGWDVFVHVSEVNRSQVGTLKENDKLSFEIETSRGKTSAARLERV